MAASAKITLTLGDESHALHVALNPSIWARATAHDINTRALAKALEDRLNALLPADQQLPTSRQLWLAKRLAKEQGLEIPEDVLESKSVCGAWIARHVDAA